ncbi:hypothetical protein HMPREF1624_05436 [Sporothrix schenckii ATCC 58251]|uniref:Major facilitator superfamily (MFS) profile domain-containing protein n=1 Tax=Sporothrix schenckii (strain ATCC 58251 / de Perez 2211183) TaxID=1391915 RepID=U7PV72_SPOS1|nr:hypothetical protein HMPREF1624_05436 [Sporothrix schenckii ATCC 58251]
MAFRPHGRRQQPGMEAIIETVSDRASIAAVDAIAPETEHEPKSARRDRSFGSEPPLLSPSQQQHCQTSHLSALSRKAERRLVWKLDLCILPIFLVVFLVSTLDRISMSNAKAMGLMGDLSLTVQKYNIAYYICFAALVIFGVPSSLLLCRSRRPSWYLGAMTVCWGVANLCAGFVQTYHGLVAVRFVLGIFEAGLQPGVIYVTSLYYTRREYQTRLSLLFCGHVAASAFGPLMAYAIGKGIAGAQTVSPKNSTTDVVSSIAPNGFKGWRWVFIVEGSVTAAIGLVACFLVVDEPNRCRYLSAEERRLVQQRVAEDRGGGSAVGSGSTVDTFTMDRLDRRAVLRSLADYKIWLGALVAVGTGTTAYSTSMFMPSILHDFGYKARDVKIHTLPVYAVAAVFMVAVSWLADRLRLRYALIMAATIVATIGYCMLLDETWMNREAKYGASFLISIGGYAALPLAYGWLVENLAGRWKRAFGVGVQSALGNMAGVVASTIYRREESPTYVTGYGVALGFLWIGAAAATALAYFMWVENRRRQLGQRAYRLDRRPEDVANLGDDHPGFRYNI